MNRDPRFPPAWWLIPALAIGILFWLLVFRSLSHAAGLVDEIQNAEAIFQTPVHIGYVQQGRASWYGPTESAPDSLKLTATGLARLLQTKVANSLQRQ